MSLDDLRDHYKASRQSNDLQLKLNGATYRTPLRLARFGNTITLKSEGIYQGDLDELNNKYDLNFSKRFTYSLNKKKRWELTKDLTSEMPFFAKDDIDVRLYETRNRNQKKANCIAVHKSKGDPIGVKKTFANLASIKKAQDIEMIAKNTKIKTTVPEKNPHVPKKNRKCSKPGIKQMKSNLYEEVIYVDADEDDENEDTSYIQYEVEYAPKTDILKYGYQNEGVKNKATKAKKFANKDIFDEYEVEISEEEDENVDNASSTRPNTLVSAVDLDDLIDQQILKMVKENSLKEYKNQMRQEMTASNNTFIDKKDRKVYIDSGSDSDSANTNRKPTRSTVSKRNSAKPIAINLNVSNQGLDSQSLKDTYGLKYAEAHLCWPRMFSINLDEEIRSGLLKKHSTNKDFDIVMWLRFEQTNKPVEYGATEFKVSILTNLNCKSIALENVNPCEVSTVSKLVEKSLEFMLSLPVSMYHQKDFSKPWNYANKSDLVDSLPNIGGKKNVKTLEEIKLDLIQGSLEKFKTTQPSTSQPQPPPVNRSNSIEVKKHDEIIDEVSENKLKSQLSTIFEKHSYECILCFDEKPNLDDCVLIKSCAHCICQSCMRAFIDSHLFNSHLNAGNLQCPGCDTNLELALMINFASNANFMEIFIRHTIERVVFVLNDYKWCPSPYCGKIIQLDLNSNPYGTVSCTCGFKMCLRCNNAPHFPAKCSQVASYYKELNVNNDFYTPEDNECVSLGKRCPLCATYIEKNGGCNHMFCVTCQKYFCWNCLVDWDTHTKSGGSCKPVEFGKIRIEFKKERKATKTRKANQVRYEDSLNHRQKRTYQTKRELAKDAKRLICTLDEEKKTEAKKYLDSMIEFLNEMHFVCEHAYVLISDYSLKRESANHIRNLISSIEVNIWLIESTFKNGSGCAALDELKRLHEKSMRCIKMIKAIKTDE